MTATATTSPSSSRGETVSPYPGLDLLSQHVKLLAASIIAPGVALARGYSSAHSKQVLARHGFGLAQQIVPTLIIPVRGVTGEIVNYQHRPDVPRIKDGKPVKYETPHGSRMVLDVPPVALAHGLLAYLNLADMISSR